jgi:hypothetical protein
MVRSVARKGSRELGDMCVGTTPSSRGATTRHKLRHYPKAQRAVDQLSDAGFPVEQTDVVGYDLRLVEHVTGRTNVR